MYKLWPVPHSPVPNKGVQRDGASLSPPAVQLYADRPPINTLTNAIKQSNQHVIWKTCTDQTNLKYKHSPVYSQRHPQIFSQSWRNSIRCLRQQESQAMSIFGSFSPTSRICSVWFEKLDVIGDRSSPSVSHDPVAVSQSPRPRNTGQQCFTKQGDYLPLSSFATQPQAIVEE